MFAIHPFALIVQSMRGHFCELRACAMWDVTNCDTVGGVLLGGNARGVHPPIFLTLHIRLKDLYPGGITRGGGNIICPIMC